MCSHRRVILHLFSKFRRDRMIDGGVMTSYRFFKMTAYSRKCTSGFRFSDGICLGRWKSICLPNFDEISQFMAEIKLLPVSENGRPPYRNSNSGVDLTYVYCTVIATHRHVILLNDMPAKFRSDRTICGGVMTSCRFFKMAAES